MISLKTHNILDYVIAVVLMACPWIFGFADVIAARNVFLILGIALAVYSLFTNYYYSIAKVIPLGVHMTLDVLTGVVLMLAPSIFMYRDQLTAGQYIIHFILGAGTILMVALTRERTEVDRGVAAYIRSGTPTRTF